jgi:hypothetical protein
MKYCPSQREVIALGLLTQNFKCTCRVQGIVGDRGNISGEYLLQLLTSMRPLKTTIIYREPKKYCEKMSVNFVSQFCCYMATDKTFNLHLYCVFNSENIFQVYQYFTIYRQYLFYIKIG